MRFFKKLIHKIPVRLIIIVLILAPFYNVIFLNKTLSSSPIAPGTFPSGPLGRVSNWEGIKETSYMDVGAFAWIDEPLTLLAGKSLKERKSLLWNPYIGSSVPLMAELQSSIFFPLKIIIYALPKIIAWDIFLIVRLLISSLFCYLYFRKIKLSRVAAVFGTISFSLSGYFLYYINLFHLNLELMIPIFFFAAELIIEKFNSTRLLFLFLISLSSVFTGMFESLPLIWGIFCLYLIAKTIHIGKQNGTKYFQKIIIVLATMISAIITASFYIIPFLEYLQKTKTIHEHSVGLGYIPLKTAISIFIPFFFGPLNGSWNKMSSTAILPYLGFIPVGFALTTFFIKESKHLIFRGIFSFIALLCFLKIFGFPLVNWIGNIPGFNVIIFTKYLVPIAAFSISSLAAIAVNSLQSSKKFPLAIFSIPVFFITIVSIFYFLNKINAYEAGYSKYLEREIFFASTIIIVFTAFLIIKIIKPKTNKIMRKLFVIAPLFILLFEFYQHGFRLSRGRAERMDSYKTPDFIEFLKKDPEKFRVFAIDRILYPNTAVAYGIEDIRIIDPLTPGDYLRLIAATIAPGVRERFTGDEWEKPNISAKALDLLNVKYVISMKDIFKTLAIDEILSKATINVPQKDYVGKSSYSINGEEKTILFAHAPAEIKFKKLIDSESTKMSFSLGMNPSLYDSKFGDGVGFSIFVNTQKKKNLSVFAKVIDPKNRQEDRIWHNHEINLFPYLNSEIEIILKTNPLKNNAYDQIGWGDISFDDESKMQRFSLVHQSNGVRVYENKNYLPRVFFVDSVEKRNKEDILKLLNEETIDYQKTAFVEEDFPRNYLENDPIVFEGKATIKSYNHTRIEISTNISQNSFLIISDNYYPGWKVYLDGKEGYVYKTNVTLRGAFVPAGTQEVVFIYKPKSLRYGIMISLAGLLFFVICRRIASQSESR